MSKKPFTIEMTEEDLDTFKSIFELGLQRYHEENRDSCHSELQGLARSNKNYVMSAHDLTMNYKDLQERANFLSEMVECLEWAPEDYDMQREGK